MWEASGNSKLVYKVNGKDITILKPVEKSATVVHDSGAENIELIQDVANSQNDISQTGRTQIPKK